MEPDRSFTQTQTHQNHLIRVYRRMQRVYNNMMAGVHFNNRFLLCHHHQHSFHFSWAAHKLVVMFAPLALMWFG